MEYGRIIILKIIHSNRSFCMVDPEILSKPYLERKRTVWPHVHGERLSLALSPWRLCPSGVLVSNH
jgi:hypothetical protein